MKLTGMAWAAILLVGWNSEAGGQAGRPVVSGESVEVRQALALEQQGKVAEAASAWAAVVKLEPKNGQAYAHLGLLEARQEHYSESIKDYLTAQGLSLAAHRPIPQLGLNLGLALFKSGHFAEAAKAFESELKRHPQPQEANRLTILAGMAHYGAHAYAAAIPYLKTAADVDKTNLSLRLTLAHCYLWTRQMDEALAVYKEILAINPESAEADMIAGEALDEKGDNAGAVQQFRAAVKANPKEPNVHFGLGYLLWTQKQYDEAVPEFLAELANDPENGQAMIYLGDTYVQQGKFAEARELLGKVEGTQGQVGLLHLDLGIVKMEGGDKEGAVAELNRAVTLDPDNVTAHFRLGRLLQAEGKKEEAKAEFAKASSLNKKETEGLYKRISEASAQADAKEKAGSESKPKQ